MGISLRQQLRPMIKHKILIGYVISGSEYNVVTTFLIVLGLILFFIGGFMGIGAFFVLKAKGDNKEKSDMEGRN